MEAPHDHRRRESGRRTRSRGGAPRAARVPRFRERAARRCRRRGVDRRADRLGGKAERRPFDAFDRVQP